MKAFLSIWVLIFFSLTWACPSNSEGIIIHKIKYNGLVHTSAYLIDNIVSHKLNKPFSCKTFQTELNGFKILGTFAKISARIETTNQKNTLHYDFIPTTSLILFPIFSQSDVSGSIAGGGILNQNLLGQGIALKLFFLTSLRPIFQRSKFSISLYSYWLWKAPIEYTILVDKKEGFNNSFSVDESSLFTKIHLRQRVFKKFHFIYKATLFSIKVPKEQKNDFFLNPDQNSELLPKLNLGFKFDSRDFLNNVKKGLFLEINYGVAGFILNSPSRYQELLLDFRKYFNINKKHIFIFSSLNTQRFGKVAVYDYFYIGGSNSFRGFTRADNLSGVNQSLNNAEYRFEFLSRKFIKFGFFKLFLGLQWVAGIDYNAVWNNSNEFTSSFNSSVYTGIHILIPFVNRIRLEFSTRTSSFDFIFQFGLFEKTLQQRKFSR